jgi:effector-binding domain-containing protein
VPAILLRPEIYYVYTIQIQDVPAQPIVSIRDTVPNPQLETFFDEACREIRAYLSQIGVAAIAEPMSLWHSSPGEIPDGFDIETCIPVERPVPAQGRIRAGELPAGTLASTIHEGPYDTMSAAFDAVWVWTQAQGYWSDRIVPIIQQSTVPKSSIPSGSQRRRWAVHTDWP